MRVFSLLAAYISERLPLRLILPVSAALALAAGGRWETPGALAGAFATACLLVAQFRIWDDLADLPRDRVAHPDRVLVAAASTRPVLLMCVGLAVVNVLWIAARDGFGPALSLLVALNGALAVWYARRRRRTAAGDHLLLAKYPAIVAIAAGERAAAHPGGTLLAMGSVYLAACVYEAWHDRTSPANGRRLLVASEAVLLVIMLAALSIGGRS